MATTRSRTSDMPVLTGRPRKGGKPLGWPREVAIRPVAVGRRNWLFAGSPRGGRAAATIYTLIESCKKASVYPQSYLADVLVRVATHPASRVDELIPANWKRLFGADA